MPLLPEPRGPLSAALLAALPQAPGALRVLPVGAPGDALADEDLQLALYCCYELHYRGFDGVDERWEWDPDLLRFRRALEDRFEDALLERLGPPRDTAAPEEMDLALRAIADADDGPSVSRFVERHATLQQTLEWLVHKSPYQLKEADPHSFAIPRLEGAPKVAMVEIQSDEYGDGRPERLHADLFATTLEAMGLDPSYGAYLDHVPGATLAGVNLTSLLGLHRRRRGALVGHLALFEMGSSLPSGRYARGLRRLGAPPEAVEFFDVHVVADAVHEHIAAVDLAGGLARQDPSLAPDVLWGARALVAVDAHAAQPMVDAWAAGVSSLRIPLPVPVAT